MKVLHASERGRSGADAARGRASGGRLKVAPDGNGGSGVEGWTPTVTRLRRSVAYPCGPESVR